MIISSGLCYINNDNVNFVYPYKSDIHFCKSFNLTFLININIYAQINFFITNHSLNNLLPLLEATPFAKIFTHTSNSEKLFNKST